MSHQHTCPTDQKLGPPACQRQSTGPPTYLLLLPKATLELSKDNVYFWMLTVQQFQRIPNTSSSVQDVRCHYLVQKCSLLFFNLFHL